MNEEEKTSVSGGGEEKVGDNTEYLINTIENIKKTTVPKEDYIKLREENKKLIDTIASGKQAESAAVALPTPEQEQKRLEEIYSTIFGGNANNLDFIKATLELRDRKLKETGEDIFLGKPGHNYSPDANDAAASAKVAAVFAECVEYADGDPEILTQELMRRTQDSGYIFR